MIKPASRKGGTGTPTRRNLYTRGVVPMPEGLASNEERFFGCHVAMQGVVHQEKATLTTTKVNGDCPQYVHS